MVARRHAGHRRYGSRPVGREDGEVTDLLARPLLRRAEPAWGSRVPWLAGVLAAAWALVAGFALAVLPGMLVWVDESAEAPVGDTLRFGAQVWLVAHRVGLQVAATDLQLAPWGLSMLFLLLLYRAARWAAHQAGSSTGRDALSVVLPAAAVYALGAGVVAGLSASAEASAVPLEAFVWAGLAAVAATSAGVIHEAGLAGRMLERAPRGTRPVLAGTAVAVAGLYLLGSALVVASAVAHSDRITALAHALEPGVVGVALLALAGAAVVPNAALWAATFALGPGFAVGAGTTVGPGGVDLGLVAGTAGTRCVAGRRTGAGRMAGRGGSAGRRGRHRHRHPPSIGRRAGPGRHPRPECRCCGRILDGRSRTALRRVGRRRAACSRRAGAMAGGAGDPPRDRAAGDACGGRAEPSVIGQARSQRPVSRCRNESMNSSWQICSATRVFAPDRHSRS
jgi:hypothetical protein